jgi:Phage P22-like portal protein
MTTPSAQSMIPRGPSPGPIEQSDDNRDGGLDPIVKEAKDRFQHCSKWEHNARQFFLDDIKFAHADAYNGYQWPNDIRRNRDVEEKPVLTINKVRQHNLQIINDAKKNKPGIKCYPVGNGATAESAQAIQALFRHIEYRSNATTAYGTAAAFQVNGGIGYIRVGTEYVDERSFDQEIKIWRVMDPLTVFLDPEAKEEDKSDSRYGFIFDDVQKDEFDKMYPEWADIATAQNSIDDAEGWVRTDYVRICEYYRKVEKQDKLWLYRTPDGQRTEYLESELKLAPDLFKLVKDSPLSLSRPTSRVTVEYHFIIGTRVVESLIWPGKYIPIVPIIGEEVIIEGIMDRKGHTRALIDPQRMYNYFSSSAVEYAALQSKSPYIAPAEAIEGYETYWNTANRVNHSVIPYRGLNDAGETIPAPQRQEPPVPAPVALQGMQTAAVEFQMASGQYEASMGQQGNERSANAIEKRERQGDTATYHYIDNMAIGIRLVAKMVLDLMPHIYDTPRLLRMQGEDGVDFELELNPQAMQIHQKKVDHLGKVVGQILNPTVGLYEVQADVGPSWGSKREETFQALSLILTQAPQLVSIIGDLLMSSSDFDKANEAAARLRRMVPPQALGEGPSPEVMQLQAQITQLTGMLQKSLVTIAEDRVKMKGHAEKRDIDVTAALTTRLKALLDYAAKTGSPVDPGAIDELLHQTVRGELANDQSLGAIASVNREDLGDIGQGTASGGFQPGPLVNGKQLGDIPPIPGARRGNDGHWYVRNYSGSTQFSRVS